MTRITLPPCPLTIPPAPIARSRAARVRLNVGGNTRRNTGNNSRLALDSLIANDRYADKMEGSVAERGDFA
jgi:hypothetical protein